MRQAVRRAWPLPVLVVGTLWTLQAAWALGPLLDLAEPDTVPGQAVDVTVLGAPGDRFALAASSERAGGTLQGVPLALGTDLGLVAVGRLDGQGRATVAVSAPAGLSRLYLQAVTSAREDFAGFALTPGKVLRVQPSVAAGDQARAASVGSSLPAGRTLSRACPPGQAVQAINADGSVTCIVPTGPPGPAGPPGPQGPPGPALLSVYDSTDKKVGETVSVSDFPVGVTVAIEANGYRFSVYVLRDRFSPSYHRYDGVFFESTDCTGTPLMLVGDLISWLWPLTAFAAPGSTVYIVDPATNPPEGFAVLRSRLLPRETCKPENSNAWVAPAVSTGLDLDAEFTPPFRLE